MSSCLGLGPGRKKGAVLILKAEGLVFHILKAAKGSYQLLMIDGNGEGEIARIKSSNEHFASRVLVAIGDAIPPAKQSAVDYTSRLRQTSELSAVDLEGLIRDARKELRRAEGVPLSPAELDEDLHKAELDELDRFAVRSLGVGPSIMLLAQAAWTSDGALSSCSLTAENFI